MPSPKKGESKDDFISRCISYMHDNEDEKYPSDDQKAAVCYSMWEQSKEESMIVNPTLREFMDSQMSASEFIDNKVNNTNKGESDNVSN